MIRKVLIAEDHEITNISLQRALEELKMQDFEHVSYCDDAVLKVDLAKRKDAPFDLLITDLYFDDDGIPQRVAGGIRLIEEVRKIDPGLKVLVFSAENKPGFIKNLFTAHDIDGFVRKARNDAKELKIAIETIANHQRYMPRQLLEQVNGHSFDFDPFDLAIISFLADGVPQKDMPELLTKKGIEASSLSNIEKRLKRMKSELNCTKNEQLIAFCKDKGII